MQIKKSGEAVRGAVLTGGLSAVAVAPLLEPWVTKALNAIAWHAGVTLPDGYHAQFIVALTTGVLWLSAHIKVSSFQGRFFSFGTAQPDPPPSTERTFNGLRLG